MNTIADILPYHHKCTFKLLILFYNLIKFPKVNETVLDRIFYEH